MLFESSFPEDELNTLLTNGKQKLLVSLEKVGTLSQRLLVNSLYPNHPYGVLADPVDYDNFSRDLLVDYAADVLQAANLTVVASGNVPHDFVAMLNRSVGQRDFGKKFEVHIDIPAQVNGGYHFVEKLDAIQGGIAMGLSGFSRSQDDFANIQFLNCVLGGYFGSRLMSNIREDKGYTYGIGSGLRVMKHDAYWAVSTEVGSEYVKATLNEIRHEFDRLRNEMIPVEEFELVRNYLTGSFVRNSDGPFAMADRFISLWSSGFGYGYYDEYLMRIAGITPFEIQETAVRYLDFDQFVVCVAGSK
jgi:predicted Zn-dependent peptidase